MARQNGERLRVGVVGASGQLGSRLTGMINAQPDMHTVIAIGRDSSSSLARVLGLTTANPETIVTLDHDRLDRLADHELDVVVDARPPRTGVKQDYESLRVPVIAQSGERDIQPVIAIPGVIARYEDDMYREGDCNVVGAAPVLYALSPYLTGTLHLRVLMQFARALNDKPRDSRINSTTITPSTELVHDLQSIFPHLNIDVADILEVPGLRYYIHTYEFDTTMPMDSHQIMTILNQQPRVGCFMGVTETSQINESAAMLEQRGDNLMPIVPLLPAGKGESRTHHILHVAVDSRRITPTANVDSIRAIVLQTEPITAMTTTDKALRLRRVT